MPATSEKQLEHLRRLNHVGRKINQSSPSQATRFSVGQKPWNYGKGLLVDRTCQFCGKAFQLPEWQVKRDRGIYCSKECFYNAKRKFGRRAQIKELYEQGKTVKEIGKELGILPSSIASMLYRMKIANRFGDGVFSTVSRKRVKTLLKEKYSIEQCELCGYNRIVEVAHLLEKKNGGEYLLNNCLALCPNCHHLFDHNLLNSDEQNKLSQIARLNGNLQRRLNYVAR